MTVLGIDCSGRGASIALVDESREIVARTLPSPRGHAEQLVPAISSLLRDAGIAIEALNLIAAGIGPGSFTGLRLAIAAAKGLALPSGRKVCGIDSFSAYAFAAHRVESAEGTTSLLVALDSRRGDAFVQPTAGDGSVLRPAEIVSPDRLDAYLHSLPEQIAPSMVIGNGARLVASQSTSPPPLGPEALLDDLKAAWIAGLAETHLAGRRPLSPALPRYMRAADATPQTEVTQDRGEIRIAHIAELDIVAALQAHCFEDQAEHSWSSDAIARLAVAPLGQCLVAVDKGSGEIVGFVIVQIAGPEAEILSIGVHPAHRRNGFGRKLLQAAIATASAADSIYLEVAEDNAQAISLYQKIGFNQIAVRKDYYEGPPRKSALILRLLLDHPKEKDI